MFTRLLSAVRASPRSSGVRGRNKLMGRLQSEIHSRASFAISCLVLVLVGCALGMMFRSSNFLSAFAVSFVPAMFSSDNQEEK